MVSKNKSRKKTLGEIILNYLLHVFVCLCHLCEVVLGSLGGDVHALQPGQGLKNGRLPLAVEEELTFEVIVH